MDALVAYGSGSEESDNGGEQQEQKQSSSREEGDIRREIPVSETPAITPMDLPPSSRVPLPLELNCEVFKCLKLPIQRKFIWGMGRDIYGIFGQKLLKKTKRVRNPHGNRWKGTNTRVTVTANGLSVSSKVGLPHVLAVQPFFTSGPHCRADGFPGTILYYYEVKARPSNLGLTGAIPVNSWIRRNSNSYFIPAYHLFYGCSLAGKDHRFELPEGAIRPIQKCGINVFGCGLVLDPEDKLAIFFTLNGKLMGRKIPINPTVDRLFPSVKMAWNEFGANFGNDPVKPFQYDIKNCPGLGLACI